MVMLMVEMGGDRCEIGCEMRKIGCHVLHVILEFISQSLGINDDLDVDGGCYTSLSVERWSLIYSLA